MSFDLKTELARVTHALDVVRREVTDRGPATLLAQVELAERCDTIAARLADLLKQIPPPKPSPPVTTQEIEIEEDALRPATWRERNLRRKGAPAPDLHKRVPTRADRTLTVSLPEPRFPGTPAKRYAVTVEFQVVEAVELPDEDDDLDADAPRKRKKKKRPPPFEYVLRGEDRQVTVLAPEVPPDAPLTPVQQAYVDRLEQIRLEVRDVTSLIAHLDREVGSLSADADRLWQAGQALRARVDALPTPADITADLDAATARIEAVRALLPGIEHDLNRMEPELPELLRRAQDACPEIV